MHKKKWVNRHALSFFVSEKINQHASFFALAKTILFILLINLLRLKLEYKLLFFLLLVTYKWYSCTHYTQSQGYMRMRYSEYENS